MSEYDFYSLVFDNYLKLENDIDIDQKSHFFQESICKLMEVAKNLDNDVFLQNAMMIISCLYHDRDIDNFDSESQDLEDLDKDEQNFAKSLILKALG